MHDIRFIRDDPAAFDRALARRGLSNQESKRFSSQNLIAIDDRRRAILRVLEGWKARLNAASKQIGFARRKGDETEVAKLMAEAAECKGSIATLEGEDKDVEKERDELLAEIPNLPAADVPDGEDANDNVEHHKFGAKGAYTFAPKQHFDLGEALGQMDFETAAKLSGARFVVLKKGLARLERALGQFFLDVHTSDPHNYTEVAPPLLVRDEVMFGTAQLPKFVTDQFIAISQTLAPEQRETYLNDRDRVKQWNGDAIESHDAAAKMVAFIKATLSQLGAPDERRLYIGKFLDDFGAAALRADLNLARHMADEAYLRAIFEDQRWLIPTAEVPLTNLVRDSIVDDAQLPLRVTACTPCFRAEAGAAGKDTRGMIRQHQFTKVELVSITTPEQSKDEHERMLACAEEVLRRLDLHYRVVTLCAGDMGFAAQKTYDIEVWLPGQGMYREISSCSNCGDFQARRMNARYRTKDRQVRHLHTLNGSGVAVGRALIAVMETYQQENGSIAVPDVLAPYMGGIKTIEK